jgi:hypothetical protein
MFYEKDWFMREIKFAVKALAQLIFHRDDIQYEVADAENLTTTDTLHRELMDLLQEAGSAKRRTASLSAMFQATGSTSGSRWTSISGSTR